MHWERWILESVAKIPPTTRRVFLFWGGGCPLNMEKIDIHQWQAIEKER